MSDASLVGLFIGTPRELTGARSPWTSSFGRQPATGPLALGIEGLPGDACASPSVHGGLDRAVLAYAVAHYDGWRAAHPGHAFPAPSFGENFLVAGYDEATVCIGDVWQVGEARLQVTQPRSPCGKIGLYNGIPDMLGEVVATARMGWLLRVLTPGQVARGDAVQLVERPNPDWTVLRVFRTDRALREGAADAAAEARAIVGLTGLAASWRAGTEQRLAAVASPGG